MFLIMVKVSLSSLVEDYHAEDDCNAKNDFIKAVIQTKALIQQGEDSRRRFEIFFSFLFLFLIILHVFLALYSHIRKIKFILES